VSSGAIKQYLTLLQAQPEPGRTEHIGWIALMSAALDELSPLQRGMRLWDGWRHGPRGRANGAMVPVLQRRTKRLAPSIRQPTPQRRSGPAIEYTE
jgi:hypothetical protein